MGVVMVLVIREVRGRSEGEGEGEERERADFRRHLGRREDLGHSKASAFGPG
jgi:hypothetical protein